MFKVKSIETSIVIAAVIQLAVTGSSIAQDCNLNFTDDTEDISQLASRDCNGNGIPDECEIDVSTDPVNAPGGPFFCVSGCDLDCNDNCIPDSCDRDCNANSLPDTCDIEGATSDDCNSNRIPSECEIPGCQQGNPLEIVLVLDDFGSTNEDFDIDRICGAIASTLTYPRLGAMSITHETIAIASGSGTNARRRRCSAPRRQSAGHRPP
jgi:hypothetical protein